MKFIANSTELSEALITVSKAISGKTNIPILEGVKMSASGDEVTLSATDLDLFIETRIKASVKMEGETVVTGKLFTEFVKKLVEVEEIELEKYSTSLVVRYKGNESEFQCMEDDTYPEIKTVSDDQIITYTKTNKYALFSSEFTKLMQENVETKGIKLTKDLNGNTSL